MADKPPFFPFYPKDLMADDLVMAMTTEAFGAYVKLLCAAWVASPPCTIPDDDTTLARITKLTPARWKNLKAQVLKPWKKTKQNRLVQKRLRAGGQEPESSHVEAKEDV